MQKTQVVLETDKLITIPEAAKILGVHFTTLYRQIKKGRFHLIRIGNQTYLDATEVKGKVK